MIWNGIVGEYAFIQFWEVIKIRILAMNLWLKE